MSVYAKVIKDSISDQNNRLTTMEVCFHRFVLPEFNTHRMFSRNFRSSRAVPTEKLIKEVRTNPALPVSWGKNQPGMQAAEELEGAALERVQTHWNIAAQEAATRAGWMLADGAHKQIVNRLLEPFLYVYGVVSFTNFENFRQLRCHKDAQPEIKFLADKMAEAYDSSTPEKLSPGEWHLPYVDEDEGNGEELELGVLKQISAARCARVSYKVFDADRRSSVAEDVALYEKLAGGRPMHASPLEHQATPDVFEEFIYSDDPNSNWPNWYPGCNEDRGWQNPDLHGNFEGWIQHRKTVVGEYFSQS